MDMGNQNTLSTVGIEYLVSKIWQGSDKVFHNNTENQTWEDTHLNVNKYMFALDLTHMLVVQ